MAGTATHITGYLGGADQAAVWRLVEAASRLGYFTQILPIRRQPDGRVIAVAFTSDNPDDRGDQRMDTVVVKLGGILSQDITIASAWEPAPGRGRQHGWLVRGGGQAILGEIIRDDNLAGPDRVLELGGLRMG
jgi:hypothetical protein